MSADVVYPPLDVPKPVAEDVWIVDSGPQTVFGVLHLPVRMTVLRLADGRLWLHAPTRWRSVLVDALEDLGRIRHLVAPNGAHWTHLFGWHNACPSALVWAAPGVARKLRRARQPVPIRAELGDAPPGDWAGQIEQAAFRGRGGFTEIAFFHRASGTLVLADTVQALEPARLDPPTRLFARAVGATRGETPAHLRRVFGDAAHRAANRAAAERLLAWAPRRVILAHGAWFRDDAPARLERAFAWLLRG
jgi:hypothetical protein